jgi:histone-lysine N-methyltransferase SETMAR
MEGIVHFELLERNLIVITERYCQQLRRLEEAIQQKRPGRRHGVILQYDNARPHTANMMKVVIQELDWEILLHPPYSPYLASSDYHLFHSLSCNLRIVSFSITAELQNWLSDFFTAKLGDSSSVGSKTCPLGGRRE